jgi:NhaP-type Na+/H+ or K+/H+ antiporter
MAVVTGFVLWLTNLELIPALILGAIVGSTSETVVIPLVNQLKMREESQSLLSVESSLNDVLAIVITVALVEAYQIGELDITPIFADLLAAFFVAIIFGVIGAFVWSILLNRIHAIKNAMFTTPAFIFVIFGVMEMLGFSGAIAALAFGITIGNIELISFPIFKPSPPNEPVGLTETEKVFFSEVAFLLKTFFFVFLGISLELLSGWVITVGLVLTAIAFVLRIPAVRLSVGKSMPIKDVSIMSIMVPKGLAAVVLASIPLQQGIVGGELIRDITYVVVLLSIVFTSFLVLLLDKTAFLGIYNWLLSVPMANLRPRRIFSSRKQSDGTGGQIIPSGAKMFGSGDEKD